MRAVILADFAVPSGGAQKVALESARALAEAGVSVTFVHAVGDAGDALLDHPLIERVGFGYPDVWQTSPLKGLAMGLWNGAAAQRLARLLADLPPGQTVVHAHQWTRAFSSAVLPVCLDSRHPTVVTLHDYFLACPNGVYYRFELDKPCWVKPLGARCLTAPCDPRNSVYKAVRTWRTALTNYVLQRKRLNVIHVSDRGRETIEPLTQLDLAHHRIDNPVRVAKGEPAAIRPDAAIAYVGRLTREKGADLVALAAREARVPALFIGEGPLEAEIRAANPDAEILGWTTPEAVDALLRGRVRALAAPSRWYETGPLTVYEALAAGVPAVASVRAGAAEKVADGETGFVVEPSVEALAEAFARLKDDALARRLGAEAYAHFWRDPPTPDAHAAKLIALYRRLLGRREPTAQGARVRMQG